MVVSEDQRVVATVVLSKPTTVRSAGDGGGHDVVACHGRRGRLGVQQDLGCGKARLLGRGALGDHRPISDASTIPRRHPATKKSNC
jgi:hypothetical protein